MDIRYLNRRCLNSFSNSIANPEFFTLALFVLLFPLLSCQILFNIPTVSALESRIQIFGESEGVASNAPMGGGGGVNITYPATYNPEHLCVTNNTSVTWSNNDTLRHTVTSNSSEHFDHVLEPSKTFTHAFNTTGNYSYFDKKYPEMQGSITVAKTEKACESKINHTSPRYSK